MPLVKMQFFDSEAESEVFVVDLKYLEEKAIV